jgi:release factor glutamine methyltransferase
MRRWSDFPEDNRDRSVRQWLASALQVGLSGVQPAERECRALADRIVAGVDDRSRTMLEVVERRYDEGELDRMAGWMDRVIDGEPVQHVVGWTDFRGLRIACSSAALVPRPETEEVVEWLLEGMDGMSPHASGRPLRVLDVGTGTGCIALAIKAARPHWEVWGGDLSDAALDLARQNSAALGLEVHWAKGDALDGTWAPWPPTFDGIISNPPYIPSSESSAMEDLVTLHEPAMALFVPDSDPFLFYTALLQGAATHLSPSGCMVAECHSKFTRQLADCWQLEAAETEVLCDLQGAERAVRIKRH